MELWMILVLGAVGLVAAGLWLARKTLTPGHVMGAYAKDAVDVAKRNFQIDLDFSEESIQQIEAIASRQFAVIVEGDGPSDRNLETFCKIWGAYIGEVFRRHHGGEWVVPQEGLFQGLYVISSDNGESSPPSKVHKRLTNGDEDNLWIYYAFLRDRPEDFKVVSLNTEG